MKIASATHICEQFWLIGGHKKQHFISFPAIYAISQSLLTLGNPNRIFLKNCRHPRVRSHYSHKNNNISHNPSYSVQYTVYFYAPLSWYSCY